MDDCRGGWRSGAGSHRQSWLVGSSLGAGMHGAVWAVMQWTQVGPCGVGDDRDGRAARGAERLTRGRPACDGHAGQHGREAGRLDLSWIRTQWV